MDNGDRLCNGFLFENFKIDWKVPLNAARIVKSGITGPNNNYPCLCPNQTLSSK